MTAAQPHYWFCITRNVSFPSVVMDVDSITYQVERQESGLPSDLRSGTLITTTKGNNTMKNTLFIALTGLSTLAGCASTNTGIVQIADDTYMYAKQDWMAYSGSVVKAELYKEANAFCASKGKKFAPLNSTAEDYKLYQSSAAAEIQFTCK